MKGLFEEALTADRFRMTSLHDEVWPLIESHRRTREPLAELRDRLSPAQYRKLGQGILRHVFLIEPVKLPKVESTKARVRWYGQLDRDQRRCSFTECFSIAADLLTGLVGGWLDDAGNAEVVELFLANQALPYELPLELGGAGIAIAGPLRHPDRAG